jgi:hypothetical protein
VRATRRPRRCWQTTRWRASNWRRRRRVGASPSPNCRRLRGATPSRPDSCTSVGTWMPIQAKGWA